MSSVDGLLIAAALLLLNAFFVAAEFAVITARRSQIEPLAETGSRRARTALRAMEHVSPMLATAQLGITVCSLGLGAVAEPTVAHLIEGPMLAVGLPEDAVHAVGFAIALALVVYLHVVIGEMIPKNLSIAAPDRAVLLLAGPLMFVGRVAGPVIFVLNALANGVLHLLRVEPKDEVASAFTLDEVSSIVSESAREGLLDDGLLGSALEFSERVAADVMVPMDKVVTIPVGSTPEQVEATVTRTGFSRFPVVRREAGPEGAEVIGYLHLKDLLYADDDRHTLPVPDKRIRTLAAVATTDDVEDALATMQRAGSHLARVVDLAGRTVGVVFLEDVLEELVGEVLDATRRDAVTRSAPPVS
jgi:CBS domain containing-hemolysin-like protein